MLNRLFTRKSTGWLLAALLASWAPSALYGQDERPRERDTREVRERDRKQGENEKLRPGEDELRRGDDRVKDNSADRLSPESDKIVRDKNVSDEARRQEAKDRLQENKKNGDAWERKTDDYLRKERKVDAHDQVTIQSSDGTRSRADMIYRDPKTGEYVMVECKASDSAEFTSNQKKVFERINEGEKVTVRGEGMGPEMRDQQIKISRIEVSRPDPKTGDPKLEPYRSGDARATNP